MCVYIYIYMYLYITGKPNSRLPGSLGGALSCKNVFWDGFRSDYV